MDLVRANYSNLQKGIYETTEYLELFLRNLLMNEKNELHNRDMHVSGKLTRKQTGDPINDPINDPIKKAEPNEREQLIIDLLRSNKGLTRGKMAEMLGCSEATVKRTIQTMTQKGLLRRIGSNKTGEWIITK